MKLSELYNEILDEDYPPSFNMDNFKALGSFAARVRYCEEHLQRISSGSARIVYKIDDEKVLKLAKNSKGLAQNEVEISQGNDSYLKHILAKVFDYHSKNLWVEMELARKVTNGIFKKIVGMDFDRFVDGIHYFGLNSKYFVDSVKALNQEMWENEFTYEILDYIGSYKISKGDLMKKSTFGVVKRNGEDDIVIIDYGLTSDVYDSYYS